MRVKLMDLGYSKLEGALFVDAEGPVGGVATMSAVDQGQVVREIAELEEVAIYMASSHPNSEYIIRGSQTAYRNYMRGRIASLA